MICKGIPQRLMMWIVVTLMDVVPWRHDYVIVPALMTNHGWWWQWSKQCLRTDALDVSTCFIIWQGMSRSQLPYFLHINGQYIQQEQATGHIQLQDKRWHHYMQRCYGNASKIIKHGLPQQWTDRQGLPTNVLSHKAWTASKVIKLGSWQQWTKVYRQMFWRCINVLCHKAWTDHGCPFLACQGKTKTTSTSHLPCTTTL